MKKTRILPRSIGILAACWTVSMTSGQTQTNTPTPEEQERYQRKLFELIDANEDGKITEREFAIAVLWDEFKTYDTNRDEKVSKAEYLQRAREKDQWSELDTAGKGYVTFEDCCRSKLVLDGLRQDWKDLKKRIGKPFATHITLADLPDLTD